MSYRPDESVLISYLYGELDKEEQVKLEKYLLENPAEMNRIQQMKTTLGIMSRMEDKEVIAPPLFMSDETRVIPLWKTSSFRIIASIAASFLLVLVTAALLGIQIRYANSELRISFGRDSSPQVESQTLTALQVRQMIDESQKEYQLALEGRLNESRDELDAAIRKTLAGNTSQINHLVKEASTASQAQIREFVAGMRSENLAQMRDYLQLSSAEQRKYADNLVTDFSRYLQEQRASDLTMFQTRFSRLEQNTDELKVETEQILASIIANGSQVQQSSY